MYQRTEESRRRTAVSISALWRQPQYRRRVLSSRALYHEDPLNMALRSECKNGHHKQPGKQCRVCHNTGNVKYRERGRIWDNILMDCLLGLP